MSDDVLVDIRHVSYKQGNMPILTDVSIPIRRGKITAVMGPSGSGKTTLLRLVGAQWTPHQGQILFEGQDIHRLRNNDLMAIRRKMGMLFQNAALFTNITVFDNVAFPLRELTTLPESLIRTIVLMKLQVVGLRGARDLMPNTLSGGMARRVALARGLALDPTLMMYDEPFAGQDPITMGVLVTLIKSLHDSLGMTSIIVSHDVPETFRIADDIYVISDQRIAGHGDGPVMQASDNPAVKQFLQGMPDGVIPFHYPARDYKEDLFHAERN